jgi:hypothetical protein
LKTFIFKNAQYWNYVPVKIEITKYEKGNLCLHALINLF